MISPAFASVSVAIYEYTSLFCSVRRQTHVSLGAFITSTI
jgi:hypothetical protein